MNPAPPTCVALPRGDWEQQAAAHEQRVGPITRTTLHRRSHGQSHPVWDFLFSYYSFPPNRLLSWVPGILDSHGHLRPEASPTAHGDQLQWTPPPLPIRIPPRAQWIASLCSNILSRPSWLACYCLHEWAMVYDLPPQQARHQSVPLRFDPATTNRIVEAQPLTCTHYDAFRFFTPNARPRNTHTPSLESRPLLEQPGCLHANMDLYKWSAKLWPWIGSPLVGECFELATRARTLDMRASPYDNTSLGLTPIPIETTRGRELFVQEQQAIANTATALRQRLLTAATTLSQLPPAHPHKG